MNILKPGKLYWGRFCHKLEWQHLKSKKRGAAYCVTANV
ncbi:MAG: hypothetical protein OFPI_23950 [Osedax symbiont Rs2]|nr:MAG: hypothetical protein OFPI_23950 [Osedax symbiont Rs2]